MSLILVLPDCPAGIEQGFQNAVAAADRAIVVTTPEVSAIRDADRVIGLLTAGDMPKIDLVIKSDPHRYGAKRGHDVH